MKFALILYNKAHWIFEANEKPDFAPNIKLVDITGKNHIQEGWDYNSKTGDFSPPTAYNPPPIDPTPTVEEMQAQTLINTEVLLAMKNIGV